MVGGKKMKKILGTVIFIFLMTTLAAQEDVVFFGGVFTTLDGRGTETYPISEQVEYLQNTISNRSNDLAIIAHSQGGVRALGYASEMSAQGEADKIKALITIGSPVKGYSPLLAGKDRLMKRADDLSRDLTGAISAVLHLPAPVELNAESTYQLLKWGGFKENILVDSIISGEIYELDGIRDLSPKSDYFESMVNPEIYDYDVKTYTVKYLVKTVLAVRMVKVGWFTVPQPYWKKIYGYKTVTERTPLTTNRIDSSIPMGFVVGYENNPLAFIKDPDDAALSRTLLTAAAWTFLAAKVKYNTEAVVTYPIFWTDWSKNAKNNADLCQKAREICDNPEKVFERLYGSSACDSFILEQDQSRNLASLGGMAIGEDAEFYTRVKANHLTELNHEEIWGAGHGLSGSSVSFDEYSIVGKWMENSGVHKTNGEFIQ
jgi:hypothetical protein